MEVIELNLDSEIVQESNSESQIVNTLKASIFLLMPKFKSRELRLTICCDSTIVATPVENIINLKGV